MILCVIVFVYVFNGHVIIPVLIATYVHECIKYSSSLSYNFLLCYFPLSLSLSPSSLLQPPAVEKEEELKDLKDRAQVRLLLWLGLEKDQEKWTECCGGGEVAVFAETVSKNNNVHTHMVSVVTCT